MTDPVEAAVRLAWTDHYRRLVGALTALSGHRGDAEDAVQEAFLRAVTYWRRELPDQPEGWLRTVAVNELRSRRRRVTRGAALLGLLPRAPEALESDDAGRLALWSALHELPYQQRESLVLFHYLDLSVDDIADQLRVPSGTVKARLARGRAALAGRLDGFRDETTRGQEARHG